MLFYIRILEILKWIYVIYYDFFKLFFKSLQAISLDIYVDINLKLKNIYLFVLMLFRATSKTRFYKWGSHLSNRFCVQDFFLINQEAFFSRNSLFAVVSSYFSFRVLLLQMPFFQNPLFSRASFILFLWSNLHFSP